MNSKGTALVLGGTGGIGGELTRQLLEKGWQVKALTRKRVVDKNRDSRVNWVIGNALSQRDVMSAASGCEVIVHGVNPAGYLNWDVEVLPMLENTLAAASQNGALVLVPGTVYNYDCNGSEADARVKLISEDSQQDAHTSKGVIKIAMEQRLRQYAQESGQVILVRAGDFFGAQANSSWFSQAVVKPSRQIKSVYRLSKPGVGHQWSYLPDVAYTMIALLERRHDLAPFSSFHMGGHWDPDGREMIRVLAEVVEQHTGRRLAVNRFPWWLIWGLSPFNPTLKALLKMRYLWQVPIRLDNQKLVEFLGEERVTPWEQAVEESLVGMNVLSRK